MEYSMNREYFESQVVNKNVIKAIERLSTIVKSEFYLAGGTALALRYGHRISLDLDFFSNQNRLENHQREYLISKIKESGSINILENTDGTCHIIIENTSVSFFRYEYPLLDDLTQTWREVPIAKEKDISAMKLSAVIGRGTKKDFVDLYFLSRHIGLKTILKVGQKKFSDHSTFIMQAAKALVYFDDANHDPMPRMLKKISWTDVKRFFEIQVPKLIKQLV